jgi:hypothetical protein
VKEIALQKLVVDAVKANGGMAHKLSNRFLVGVADLLVKMPNGPATLLEVKQREWGPQLNRFILDVTVPQQRFLKNYADAGMTCGVMSFVQRGGRKDLSVAIFGIDELITTRFYVMLASHESLGAPSNREFNLINTLICGQRRARAVIRRTTL